VGWSLSSCVAKCVAVRVALHVAVHVAVCVAHLKGVVDVEQREVVALLDGVVAARTPLARERIWQKHMWHRQHGLRCSVCCSVCCSVLQCELQHVL